MKRYAVSQLAPHVILRNLRSIVARDRATTAEMLAYLAEVDAQKLFAPEAYPSMQAFCVGALGMSEDQAAKRIHAARAARRFPAILPALADGQLNLSGVGLLAPHLGPDNAAELLAAAANQPKAAIERLLAARFPRPDAPTCLSPLAASAASQHAPGHVAAGDSPSLLPVEGQPEHAPGHVAVRPTHPRVTPLSADRDAFQCTFRRETSGLLRYAQALLGHTIPSGDLAEVIHRCLCEAVQQLEKRKFGVGSRSRPVRRGKRGATNPRVIPMHVRREVWLRDGGRCTFTSDRGHRCDATRLLETLWNDGLAVVGSSRLREERPTAVACGHPDRGLAPAAPEPHTRGARHE